MLSEKVSSPTQIKLVIQRLRLALQTVSLGGTQGRFCLLHPRDIVIRFDLYQKITLFNRLPHNDRHFNDFTGDFRRDLDLDFRPDFPRG